jgi:4-hydroxy-tetrahydrodipicolinate reductase
MISGDDKLAGGISTKTTLPELEKILNNSDILIDFSTPKAILGTLEIACKHNVAIVSGTTGFSKDDFEKIKEFSNSIPILHASNFSVCVHLMAVLLKKCEKVLHDFDFNIIDMHHSRKKDAPSGTALYLAERIEKKAQIVSIRSGNICGDHVCNFVGENEMLSISHRVFNKNLFAAGALNCARWIMGKKPKLYTMRDYLEDKLNCLE